MLTNCLIVGIGGFIGSIFRYLIQLLPLHDSSTFPYKTLIVNIIGCLIIGLIVTLAEKYGSISDHTILLIKTGICGGLTTFSTFALETQILYSNGHTATAVLYVLTSVIFGILAVNVFSWIIK